MIAIVAALILAAGSIVLMVAAVLNNQLDPNYSSALAVPLANIVSFVLALVAASTTLCLRKRHNDLKLHRAVMILSISCVVILVVLFPISNLGYLSRVH